MCFAQIDDTYQTKTIKQSKIKSTMIPMIPPIRGHWDET